MSERISAWMRKAAHFSLQTAILFSCLQCNESENISIFLFFLFLPCSHLFNRLCFFTVFLYSLILMHVLNEQNYRRSTNLKCVARRKDFVLDFMLEKKKRFQLRDSNKEQRKCRSIFPRPELNMTGDSWFRRNWFEKNQNRKQRKGVRHGKRWKTSRKVPSFPTKAKRLSTTNWACDASSPTDSKQCLKINFHWILMHWKLLWSTVSNNDTVHFCKLCVCVCVCVP